MLYEFKKIFWAIETVINIRFLDVNETVIVEHVNDRLVTFNWEKSFLSYIPLDLNDSFLLILAFCILQLKKNPQQTARELPRQFNMSDLHPETFSLTQIGV